MKKYALAKVDDYIYTTSRVLGEVMVLNEKGLDELMLEPYTKTPYDEEEWLLVEEAYTRMTLWYKELDLVDKIMLKDRLQLSTINDLEIKDDNLRDFIVGALGRPMTMDLF